MSRWIRSTLAGSTLAVWAAAVASPALAQTVTTTDQASIWSFQVENDAVSTLKGTSDQYYTSGLRIGWTSGADAVPFIADVGHDLWDEGTTRLSLDISQSLFTPRNTQINPPNPQDRPYAGILIATAGLVHDNAFMRDLVSVSLGDIGPGALGREVQNGFHSIIGDTPNRGWDHQLDDQPAFQLLGQRSWRVALTTVGPIEYDAVPSATLAGGDIRDYVQAGGVLRFGQGLASDFGTPRIEPGLNGTDAYTNVRPLAWYGFAGVDGQAVGYDVTLDGSTFRTHSLHVSRIWDVGEMVAGAAVMWHGLRLTYTQTWQTQEFRGAKSGLFNFGSLAVSAKF
jgi:hypothetical protein